VGAPKPNILLFFLESVRAEATSVYNPSLPTTPFLAKLAKRSLVAEQAYCFTNGTAKEMFAAFSGHPPRLIREHVEAGRLPTGSGLPRELVRLGYQTSFFYAALEFHERQLLMMKELGFQEHFTGPRLSKAFPEILRFTKRTNEGLDKKRSQKELNILRNYYGYEDRSLIKPILSWIRKHREKPWFLSTLNLTTHHPYHAPNSWKRRVFPIPIHHPLPGEFQEYLNAVAYLDSVLEELFERMEREGLLKNTVVVLIGDHGESFKENGVYGHGHGLDENGIRIPLLVFGPKELIGPPRRVQGLRSILDLVPTLASIVGVRMPTLSSFPLLGSSLLEEVPKGRELFLSAWLNPKKTALLQGKKRFLFDESFRRLEVYDLAVDPLEGEDLFLSLPSSEAKQKWKRMAACQQEIRRFFVEGEAAEILRIRRKSLPLLKTRLDVKIGENLLLKSVEFPEEVPFFGYGTLRLGFRVFGPLPPSASLELRFVQNGEAIVPLCILDPNRLPLNRWRKGDAILIPIPLFFPNFSVKKGSLSLRMRVVDRALGRSLLPKGTGRKDEWIPLGTIKIQDSSWIPPRRTREEVLGLRFEGAPLVPRESKPIRRTTQAIFKEWIREASPQIQAHLLLRLRTDLSPLEKEFKDGTPEIRWKLVPLFERLGTPSVPLLARLLDTHQKNMALPAAEALRRIGFSCLESLVPSLVGMSSESRERVLSWIRGIQVDPGPGLQLLFLDYLGQDLVKAARAQALLAFSPRASVKMLSFGIPKVREGEDLRRALVLIRILGEQASSLRPILLRKLQKVPTPWKKKIQETLSRISPSLSPSLKGEKAK
jgi:arylsulfatase A-like enzyme